MILSGPCSEFGGPNDKEMAKDTGLSFYEAWEANKRHDLFSSAADTVPTWKRLRTACYYIALNIPRGADREWAQNSRWRIRNPTNGEWVVAWLVDRGPSARSKKTGEPRVVDLSPGIMKALKLQTDQTVIVEEIICL